MVTITFNQQKAEALIGTRKLNCEEFVFFALRPDSLLINRLERTKILALSIFMGIMTLGIGHLICKIICAVQICKIVSLLKKNPPEITKGYEAALKIYALEKVDNILRTHNHDL